MFLIYDRLAVLSPERCQVALRRGRGDQLCSITFHGCRHSWEAALKLFHDAAGDPIRAGSTHDDRS